MTTNLCSRMRRPTVGLVALLIAAGSLLGEDLRDWGKKLPAHQRFVVLSDFDNRAVLDKETQLVWERFPADLDGNGLVTSADWTEVGLASGVCFDKRLGGRMGWRLPSVTELSTLLDPNRQSPPFLPDGHPFVFCLEGALVTGCPPLANPMNFWTNTSWNDTVTRWQVDFLVDLVSPSTPPFALVWCVRGPVAGP